MKLKNYFAAMLSCFAMSLYAASEGYDDFSPMDITVFEEADEIQTYNDHGYSRGDIKNLFFYKYDPKNEQAVTGNIVKVLRVQYPDENSYLVVVLRTDTGDYLVNLGPVWFADEQNMVINEGDSLQIKGSKIRTNGRYIIIAAEVKKSTQALVLRNQNGSSQWGTPKAQRGGSFSDLRTVRLDSQKTLDHAMND